ncbi:unnamed protein product [Lampetra fluviatilis]
MSRPPSSVLTMADDDDIEQEREEGDLSARARRFLQARHSRRLRQNIWQTPLTRPRPARHEPNGLTVKNRRRPDGLSCLSSCLRTQRG